MEGQRPEHGDRRPAAPPVRLFEHVVGPHADRRRRAHRHGQQQADQHEAERQREARDAARVADRGQDRHAGEGDQPRRPGDGAPDVQPADVVDLGDAPADPQGPRWRPPSGQAVERVEKGLVPDEDGDREVHERQRREGRQRAAVGELPRASAYLLDEHGEVDQHDGGHQAAVRHHPRVLGRGAERAEALPGTLADDIAVRRWCPVASRRCGVRAPSPVDEERARHQLRCRLRAHAGTTTTRRISSHWCTAVRHTRATSRAPPSRMDARRRPAVG